MSDEKNTKLPETLDDAVSHILDELSEDKKETVKNTKKFEILK